ncbi:MAG: purine-nucleoside/S-methyl-5-thioadenosine phosphorylase / adenosine deaminase [Thermoleophilaceae bacterium]|nr:purine-nucleoside/S-methyl-5-thioadenosine phosphorylase / adenosine deaminase [Thermoleophilaceae bacterium]
MKIDAELPGARVVFSTRHGGVSAAPYESLNLGILTGDDSQNVRENRRRLAGAVGLAPADIAMGEQVHEADLQEWTSPPENGSGYGQPGAPLEKVDGHVTDLAGLGLLVLVADCFPVALAGAGRVAMLHCGWRPLAGGIVERALATFDQPPSAVVGPGICQDCYEVGPEVLEAFADLDGVADGRMLDLRAVAEQKLRADGVVSVDHVALCTQCRPDLFFSHRRDGPETGRQAGIVWRTA